MSTTSARRLPRAVRERQMLDAAVRVFARRGFHAASMDEIADEARISKPMVYAYLGTKDELFLACLRREATSLLEALAAGVRPAAAPDDQLWNGLRAVFGFVAAHRDGWLVLYRQSTEPFASERRAMRGRIIEVVADLLESACVDRPVRGRPEDVVPVAHALVGAAESMADWLVDHPEEDPDVTATRLMNLVWLGAGNLLDGRTWGGLDPVEGAAGLGKGAVGLDPVEDAVLPAEGVGAVDGQGGEDDQDQHGGAGLDGDA